MTEETLVDAFELSGSNLEELGRDSPANGVSEEQEEFAFLDEEDLQKANDSDNLKRKERAKEAGKTKQKRSKSSNISPIESTLDQSDPLVLKKLKTKGDAKQKQNVSRKEDFPQKSMSELMEKYCVYLEMNSDKASKMKKELEHLQAQWPQMFFQITKTGLRALNLNGETRNLFVSIEWPSSFFTTFYVENENQYLLHFEEALLIKRLCNVEKFDSITFVFSKLDFEQHKSTMETLKQIIGHKMTPDAAKPISFVKATFSCLPHLELKLKTMGGKGSKRSHDLKTKVRILAKMILHKEAFWTTPIIEIRYPFILKELSAEDFKDQIAYFIKNSVTMVYLLTDGHSLHLIGKPEKEEQSSPLHVIIAPEGAPSHGSKLPIHDAVSQVISDFEAVLNSFNEKTPDKWKGGEYSLAFLQSFVKCIHGKDQLVSLFFGIRLPFVMKTFNQDSTVPVFIHIFNTNA